MDNRRYRYVAPVAALENQQLPTASGQHQSRQTTTADGSSAEQRRGLTINRFDDVPALVTPLSDRHNFQRVMAPRTAGHQPAFLSTEPASHADRRVHPRLNSNQVGGINATYNDDLGISNALGRRLAPRPTEANMQTFHPYANIFHANPFGVLQFRHQLSPNLQSGYGTGNRPATLTQTPSQTINMSADNSAINILPDQPATSSNSAIPTSTLSFKREREALSGGDFALAFKSAEEARPTPYPRRRQSNSFDDVENVKAHQSENVRRITRAIDSCEYLGPQPGKRARDVTGEEKKKVWDKFQQHHHAAARKILDQDCDRKFLESRSWMILEEIVRVHQELVEGDNLRKCSERLDAVIACLEGYAIIRGLALKNMDISKFVSNPKVYAEEKAEWKWINDGRPNVARKGKRAATSAGLAEDNNGDQEGSGASSSKKRKADATDATPLTRKEPGSVKGKEGKTRSKAKNQHHASIDPPVNDQPSRVGFEEDVSGIEVAGSSNPRSGTQMVASLLQNLSGAHPMQTAVESNFPNDTRLDANNAFQGSSFGLSSSNYFGSLEGSWQHEAFSAGIDSVEASIRSSTYPADQPFFENTSFAPVGVAAVPGD